MNRKPDPYGRDATRPYHIPLKGWWQVAQRVWSESNRDNLSVVAAGCAFFALFAVRFIENLRKLFVVGFADFFQFNFRRAFAFTFNEFHHGWRDGNTGKIKWC